MSKYLITHTNMSGIFRRMVCKIGLHDWMYFWDRKQCRECGIVRDDLNYE